MANWYGTARTNYVRFKDAEAFAAAKKVVDACGMEWHEHGEQPLYAMISGNDDGSFSFNAEDEETEEDIEYEWADIAQHMADNQVLVAIEAGAEKLRYVSGHASAYTNDGRSVFVSLSSIYALSEKEFAMAAAPAEYTEFKE